MTATGKQLKDATSSPSRSRVGESGIAPGQGGRPNRMSDEMTTLGELISLQRGYDLTEQQRQHGDVPIVGSAGIHGYHKVARAKGPGVTLGRSGGSFGKVTFVKEDYWPHNTTIFVTDFKGNDPVFIRYLLESLDFTSLNSGSAQQSLNRNFVYPVKVRAFSTSAQRRIVSILSAYDELIENNQRRIKILETMARNLYREWFVHFRFPGHEKVRRVSSRLGEIPEGWEVRLLGDVVEDIVDYRGKTPSKLNGEWVDEGIPALSALNVKGGRLVNLDKSRHVNEELYSRWMKNPLSRGDVLMTSEAPLGELYFLCKEQRYCLSQRLFSIRANRKTIAPVILYLCMDSERTQDELHSRSSGATVSGIRQSELRKIPVVVAPHSVQSHAEPALIKLAELKAVLDESTNNLRSTRDLLLPRLLSGSVAINS